MDGEIEAQAKVEEEMILMDGGNGTIPHSFNTV